MREEEREYQQCVEQRAPMCFNNEREYQQYVEQAPTYHMIDNRRSSMSPQIRSKFVNEPFKWVLMKVINERASGVLTEVVVVKLTLRALPRL